MSFFAELKRRNVFRVGLAYAVAAWVLLQVFDVIGEILELPAWGGKLILALLLVGFFLALILAWAYELTPEGVRRESEVDRSRPAAAQAGRRLNALIMALLVVAVAYLLFDKFWLQPRLQDGAATAAAPAQPAAPDTRPPDGSGASRQSIAVLPFDNRSRQTEDEPFVEGIHDDLLTNLARIGALKVISRTSVGKYRDTEKTIPEIAAELGVATVMEGAVQRSGDTVRINVQLIDARTDQHLWAEIFDRRLTAENLFAIQSEISGEIARALQARLSPEDEARLRGVPTDDLAAYDAYLEGRQLMGRRNSESLARARAAFEAAIARDGDFALAWAGLAQATWLFRQYGNMDFARAMTEAEAAARRALELDPATGEAQLVIAELQAIRGEDAEPAYRRAIELSPGSAMAHHWYANYLNAQPLRLQDALTLIRKASQLDPLSPSVQGELADIYLDLGRYDEAERRAAQLLTLDPSFVPGYRRMGQVMRATGRFDQAALWFRRALDRDPGNVGYYFDLLWNYIDLDDREALEALRDEAQERAGESDNAITLDMILAMHAGNYRGALEHSRALFERTNGNLFIRRVQGWVNNMIPDFEAATAAFAGSDPLFFDDASRLPAIRRDPLMACWSGFAMLQTGAATAGRALIDGSIDFLVNELPKHVEHADRWGLEVCQASAGQHEAALRTIEQQVAHRHLEGWFFWERHNQFKPLWNDPRFLSITAGIRQQMAKQRENLRRLMAAESVGAAS